MTQSADEDFCLTPPWEVELTGFYDEVKNDEDDPEIVMPEPMDLARSYYVEDNRPVLYDPEAHRE